jgi:hypothetical protein
VCRRPGIATTNPASPSTVLSARVGIYAAIATIAKVMERNGQGQPFGGWSRSERVCPMPLILTERVAHRRLGVSQRYQSRHKSRTSYPQASTGLWMNSRRIRSQREKRSRILFGELGTTSDRLGRIDRTCVPSPCNPRPFAPCPDVREGGCPPVEIRASSQE